MSGKRLLVEQYANRKIELVDDRHLTHNSDKGFRGIGRVMTEDCEPYIEQAKRISEMTPDKEFRHAAIIPHFVYADWLIRKRREKLPEIPKEWIRAWVNDPDNRMFRTWPGKI